MTDLLLISKFQTMPEELKKEALHYFDYLLMKYYESIEKTPRPVFGSAKGKYELMPDFDEPLEDSGD
ncbi:MAG: DUF2281 domain-containing protein [Leptospiraceae bacterium]|nr:DUF2281 domain-containing protein [Leptospiraceae bacterium]MCP5498491.1 DUF2281 domain-containing protein [Leptospiraceae bacterium]